MDTSAELYDYIMNTDIRVLCNEHPHICYGVALVGIILLLHIHRKLFDFILDDLTSEKEDLISWGLCHLFPIGYEAMIFVLFLGATLQQFTEIPKEILIVCLLPSWLILIFPVGLLEITLYTNGRLYNVEDAPTMTISVIREMSLICPAKWELEYTYISYDGNHVSISLRDIIPYLLMVSGRKKEETRRKREENRRKRKEAHSKKLLEMKEEERKRHLCELRCKQFILALIKTDIMGPDSEQQQDELECPIEAPPVTLPSSIVESGYAAAPTKWKIGKKYAEYHLPDGRWCQIRVQKQDWALYRGFLREKERSEAQAALEQKREQTRRETERIIHSLQEDLNAFKSKNNAELAEAVTDGEELVRRVKAE